MNPLVLTCLLCFVCSDLGAQGSETTLSSDINAVTGGPESGEVIQGSQGDEDDALEEKHSGEASDKISHDFHLSKDAKRNRRGKGKKKNKHKSKSTTAFNPEHTSSTDGYTSALGTTEDPCASTHLDYCIHGYCKHMEGLQEPVCICMKGYQGVRCGIQTLTIKTSTEQSSSTELVQTVLVIVAVVLSAISCTAILLMTCAQSHKNFLASYLGTWAEQEKLQKPVGDPVV